MTLATKLAQRAFELGRAHRLQGTLSDKLRQRIIEAHSNVDLDRHIRRACEWLEKHPECALTERQKVLDMLDMLMVEQAKRQAET